MPSAHDNSKFYRLADQTPGQTFDVFGPTVEFLTWSDEFCVMTGENGLESHDAPAGDFLRIPGHVPHAHRNVSNEPAVELIITTARLGRFFQEIGRPVTDSLAPPTPPEFAHFIDVAVSYGYVLGSPGDNAAVGITVPEFPTL